MKENQIVLLLGGILFSQIISKILKIVKNHRKSFKNHQESSKIIKKSSKKLI